MGVAPRQDRKRKRRGVESVRDDIASDTCTNTTAARLNIRSVGETILPGACVTQRRTPEEPETEKCRPNGGKSIVELSSCGIRIWRRGDNLLAWQPADRAESATSSPSFSSADNAHFSTCLTAPPLCHTRIRSQSRRDAGRLVAWLSARLSLSLPAVKPSATNKAISS